MSVDQFLNQDQLKNSNRLGYRLVLLVSCYLPVTAAGLIFGEMLKFKSTHYYAT